MLTVEVSPDRENSLEPVMITIPEGWFMMGSASGPENEQPVHSVWVDRFLIGCYTITNAQFQRFVSDTSRPGPAGWNDPAFSHPLQPVTSVSWFDARAYCDWLSALAGGVYRLPTEAEWERAARGGLPGKLHTWGDEPPESQPHYFELWRSGPEQVGVRPPNGFGLFDMSENVHEWCSDWYDPDYYGVSPDRNPTGPSSGSRRSSRGGSWRHQIKITRVAARSSIPPDFRYADYGFRTVKEA
ncbi:MAG TPA: SUMF1/EgtB/PvdO family nonheme iron enzyme [Blastocatellia bacterium]|nr:SUMF1/EgtB/PvdO family nonheme iron enzyme [Blastocatellia bacterium]